MQIFHEIFYRPLFNGLVSLYNIIPGADLGLAIIVLTIVIRVILAPLSIKAARSQKAFSDLGPELNALKEKYKKDQAAYSSAVLALYKEKGANPLTGCLPILIQLPIIFALYRVFMGGINENNIIDLYSFISKPEIFSTIFIGIADTTQKYWIIAPIIGLLQYFQAKISISKMSASAPASQASLNKQMLYLFPFILIIVSWSLPLGVNLYLATTTAFSIGEQWYIRRTG